MAVNNIEHAATVAMAVNPTNPEAAVTKRLAMESGVKVTGWIGDPRTFWKEHSTQVWAAVTGLDLALNLLAHDIPADWSRVGHWVAIAGGITGLILKYRAQVGLVLDRIRAEIRSRTP